MFACFYLVWYGAQVAWDHYQRGVFNPTLLEFPKGLVLAVIPIGSLLLLAQFLRRIYDGLNTWKILRKGD
jgi:TRAP-type C4-dicarboxylate transport system permease small subunit